MSTAMQHIDQARAHVSDCVKKADTFSGKGVWIHRCTPGEIDAQFRQLQEWQAGGRFLPLFGWTLAVKDNIDVAGIPTTAGCPAYAYVPSHSATVVQRLQQAGAIVVGKTNLDQFATGLVGVRSPYGPCENFFDRKYISGGSSSGSAVALAAGMCDFSLGTDTAGSGRVPASFNNLVGLKPTRGLISCTGVVPACKSLDCVSIFARDCQAAQTILNVAEGFDDADIYSRDRKEITARAIAGDWKFIRAGSPPETQLQFFGNTDARQIFRRSIARIGASGAMLKPVDYQPFQQTADLLYEGPWVAERLAAIRSFYDAKKDQMLEVTRKIIGGAERISAADTFAGIYRLGQLRRATEKAWDDIDVMVLPTAGTIYTIEQVQTDPVQLNRNLGYYTNFVNLLDLCALAIPAGFLPNNLPWGITLVAPAGNEKSLLALGRAFCSGGEI